MIVYSLKIISNTNERLWTKELNFNFGNKACLSIYHDGQQREDVKCSLKAYTKEMMKELKESEEPIKYTGEDMMLEVYGKYYLIEYTRNKSYEKNIVQAAFNKQN